MALVLDAAEPNKGGYIRSVLHKIATCSIGRSLDIVLVNAPNKLTEVELLLRECYGYCLDTEFECRVFPSLVVQDWPFVFSNLELDGIFSTPVELIDTPELVPLPSPESDAERQEERVVALGGTFDHFHIGHKLLLTMGGLWARHELIVGVTGHELLQNKKYASELEDYNTRADAVRDFVDTLFPALRVTVHQINDVYGPTGSEEAIDALVVSKETVAGGATINEFRRSKGWRELKVLEIGLVPAPDGAHGTEKLSSTWYREIQAKRKAEALSH